MQDSARAGNILLRSTGAAGGGGAGEDRRGEHRTQDAPANIWRGFCVSLYREGPLTNRCHLFPSHIPSHNSNPY